MPTLTEDRDAIRDLMARYALYIDAGRVDEWLALFAEDGTFDTGLGDPLVGHAALRTFAESMTPGTLHHMFMDHVIDVDGNPVE